MKLLQVISSMDPRTGGPCQAVRNYFPEIIAKGNSMEVVCLDNPRADYLRHEHLPIHALGQGRGPWHYHPAIRPWLEANLPRFDAVILNGLWQFPGFALSQVTQLPGMPEYFVFPHGMLDPWFQRAPGRRLKAVRNWLHWKLFERHVIHQARAVLFTCAEEMRLARETFQPYHPQSQINVGFGIVSPPEYYPGMSAAFFEKCPGLKDEPYLLFLGRINPKKGVDILIRAYAELWQTAAAGQLGPLPKLVMAGPGLETTFGQQMHSLVANTCPPSSVFWPGMLTGDAKWGSLHHAGAFVLTSHQENFGIAVVESLACGTPVLISNQINIWREIDKDKAGLVAADTLTGARQLLRSWQNHSPIEKQVMKDNAKICYEKNFRMDTAAQKLLEAIQDALGMQSPETLIGNKGALAV